MEPKPQPQTQVRPEARGGASLTYTGKEGVYLLVGGADRLPQEFADLWLLKVLLPTNQGVSVSKPALGWKKLPAEDKFRARTGHTGVLWRERVFIYGGQSFKANSHTSELWIYCATTGSFSLQETTNTPPPRNSHGACVDEAKGLMYVYGGANDQGLLSDFHVLDLKTFQWTQLKPQSDGALKGVQMHSLVFHEGKVLVVGGMREADPAPPGAPPADEELSKVISSYCPETNTWTHKVKALPSPLASFGCVSTSNNLYIVGGLTPAGFSDCVYKVDLQAKKSTQVFIKKFTEDYPEFKSVEQMIACSCSLYRCVCPYSLTSDSQFIICFGGSAYEAELNSGFCIDLKKFEELQDEITKNLVM